MPRQHTQPVSLNLTAAQFAAVRELAGDAGLNAYLRRLIAEDAARRGIEWPDNLIGRGKYPRGNQS